MIRYPYLPLLTILAALLNNTAYSWVQILIGRTFDLISSPDWMQRELLLLAGGVLLTSSMQGLLGLVRNWSMEFIAQRIARDSRDELFASLLGKSQTFFGRQRIGDIMARATNDVRALNLMFSPGINLIIDSFIGIVVPVYFISTISTSFLLVPAIFLVFFAVTVVLYVRELGPVSIAQREIFGTMNAGLQESISGIEVVKGNAQEKQQIAKFIKDATSFKFYTVRSGEIQARYLPLLVFAIARAGALLHGLILWQQGTVTLGQVVAYMGLIGALRFSTFISIFSYNLVQLGMASANRILEMINTETALDENVAGTSQPILGEVKFEGVSFGYNESPVIKNIDFDVQPGQTVAIVGQTGSGKTTLTRLINRIFDADAGRVTIDGIDVREWNLESLRSQISTIEQDVFLFSSSLESNIGFGRDNVERAEVVKAAEEAQAHSFIADLPEGYETEIGERGVTLSGGQKQRIAIARAFLTDPRILILDDSTSAIDSATEDQIQQAMKRISAQRTTFLITHRLSQIRWADRILVMREGQLVAQGTHDELLGQSDDYRRIFARYD